MKLSWLTAQQSRISVNARRRRLRHALRPASGARALLAALLAGFMVAGPAHAGFCAGTAARRLRRRDNNRNVRRCRLRNRRSRIVRRRIRMLPHRRRSRPTVPARRIHRFRLPSAFLSSTTPRHRSPSRICSRPIARSAFPQVALTNSPRVDQLVRDGKLQITLQDAVELALENSMDIVVQRYNPWFGDTDILQTEGGGLPFGVTGAEIRQSTANVPFLNYDPTITQAASSSTIVGPR